MRRIPYIMLFIIVLAVLMPILLNPILVSSQTNQIRSELNKTLQDARRAELSGANTEEMGSLIDGLNSVAQLEDELHNLPSQDTSQRAQILAQISSTLSTVDTEANQIEISASQRTFLNHLVTYSSGVIGALLVTLTCHYCVLLQRKYRIKRTFQMDIIPK